MNKLLSGGALPERAGTALKERAVSWQKENTLRTRRLLCHVPKRLHQTSEEAGDTFSFIFFSSSCIHFKLCVCARVRAYACVCVCGEGGLSKLCALDNFRQKKQQQP